MGRGVDRFRNVPLSGDRRKRRTVAYAVRLRTYAFADEREHKWMILRCDQRGSDVRDSYLDLVGSNLVQAQRMMFSSGSHFVRLQRLSWLPFHSS